MAIEIPNFFEAGGLFSGFDPPLAPFTTPIANARGIQPFDPAAGPGNIVGGFTREAAGAYVIGLVRSIDFLEALAIVTPFPGSPLLGAVVSEGQVGVVSNPVENDANFYLHVMRISYGEDLT